ncbi:MAG: YlbF family regulator [Anaerolineales bacterium]|nr:YlbF family regulator [Anaerolineales bacterium]
MLELMLPAPVRTAAEALAQALLASEPFTAYEEAQARLMNDVAARTLLNDLAAAQAQLRRGPAVTQAEIAHVRALQGEVQANAAIQDFALAQQGAVTELRAANAEISQLLGVDFAALAKRSGCC